MALITSVEARTLRVPLPGAVAIATRAIQSRHYTLVRLGFDDNSQGIGLCYGGADFGRLITDAVTELLRPLLLGGESYEVGALWQKIHQETLHNGRQGVVMRAISAVDIAIWDRNSKAHGLPLWKYLGAVRGDKVPAYASGGYYAPGKTVSDLVGEVKSYIDLGFTAVKMRVGKLPPGDDEERVAAVRAAVGDDVSIMLDANNAWTDLASALRWLRRLEQYGPYWIEEPFGPDDIVNHARLRERTTIPVATGELLAGRWAHHAFLRSDAVDVLQPDACVCGGITEFRRIAAQALGFGVPVAPHSMQPIHVHLLASEPNALMLEYFSDLSISPIAAFIDRPPRQQDGYVVMPQDPGLGFDFVASQLDRFGLDPWH